MSIISELDSNDWTRYDFTERAHHHQSRFNATDLHFNFHQSNCCRFTSAAVCQVQVWQYEDSLLRLPLSTVDHPALELGVSVVHVGSKFEKTEHGVEAVDVEAGGSVEDARENCLSIFSPSHCHVFRTEIFDAQVQRTLFIQQRAKRFTVDEHHIGRSSCFNKYQIHIYVEGKKISFSVFILFREWNGMKLMGNVVFILISLRF